LLFLFNIGHYRGGSFAQVGYKFSFINPVAIAMGTKVYPQVFYAYGVAFGYIGYIQVGYILSVYYYHQATANGFHLCATGYYHAGIFAQANAYTGRVGGHGLRKPAKAASFFKMRVYYGGIYQAKAGSHFYFALQVGTGGVALIYHGTAHGHCPCTCAGY
jgi:hypothetical protein